MGDPIAKSFQVRLRPLGANDLSNFEVRLPQHRIQASLAFAPMDAAVSRCIVKLSYSLIARRIRLLDSDHVIRPVHGLVARPGRLSPSTSVDPLAPKSRTTP